MRKIPFMSLKGGTGKSSCTAHVGKALVDMGYYVGFLDLDIHGPNLPLSLGFDKPPPLNTDTANETIIPAKADGYEIVSMASHFGEGSRILWHGEKKLDLAKQLLAGVIAWGDVDYLLIDTPPSQGEEITALLEYLPDIYGIVIICQPTDFSRADTERVLDLLRDKKIPILGIIANMDGAICPDCGNSFYPFLTKRADIETYATKYKIPVLASIPQASSITQLEPLFTKVARTITTIVPTILPTHEKRKRFKRESLKIILGGK